jgi:hypothetical protein
LIRSRIERVQSAQPALAPRIKEPEQLERLVEKVGRIDFHRYDGQGFDTLLTELVRLTSRETA